ncbi:hypothetical protein CPBP_00116 [Candidatus Bodocaedibacter vickermanii]|uniref:Uncharacterized protein n=2 Tax=Candidatus Bodocaedibacter vickermanii TaxID=2741701 RepID=A0A7L9RS24_9PROT|nr:hypothetical protein CPBP_00116 [Candidatus Paracaedibacteraceae bacterium 'Lake Konstanz']
MLKLRYGLLVTVLGHFLVPKVIGSEIVEDCEPSTPLGVNSQEMLKDKTTKITPGKKVAKIQADMLTPNRVKEALGNDVFAKLDGILWDDVSSPDTDFESPNKRALVRKLRTLCAKSSTAKSQTYLGEVLKLREEMLRVHAERLIEHSKDYFQQLFPKATISFHEKLNGDQLGTKVLIEQKGRSVTYYVKTHSGGIKKSGSSAAETVNPKELLTYALLEALHFGPGVHFFGRDKQHLYIATKDINTDGQFTEYSLVKQDNVKAVFGALTDVDLKQLNPEVVESMIAQDIVAQNFIRMMSVLDLFARLIRLTDLQTNGGNFGFVQFSDHESFLSLLKIIDFRLVAEKYFQRVHQGDWDLFLSGEGFFEDNLDERVEYILQKRDVALRTKLATDIFQHELAEWTNVMSAAIEKVKNAIELLSEVSEKDKADLFRKLDDDAKILIENFNFFHRELGLTG